MDVDGWSSESFVVKIVVHVCISMVPNPPTGTAPSKHAHTVGHSQAPRLAAEDAEPDHGGTAQVSLSHQQTPHMQHTRTSAGDIVAMVRGDKAPQRRPSASEELNA